MRALSFLALALLAAACEEQPPPNTPAAVGAPTYQAAPPPTPQPTAPPPAATPAPAPPKTADLGMMSNDPETDRKMRSQVMDAIQPNRKKMKACYDDAIRRDPQLEGQITIRLTVAPSGEPVVIDDAGSSIKDDDFVTCVRAVLSHIDYPKWRGKAVTVIVPVEFFRRVEGP